MRKEADKKGIVVRITAICLIGISIIIYFFANVSRQTADYLFYFTKWFNSIYSYLYSFSEASICEIFAYIAAAIFSIYTIAAVAASIREKNLQRIVAYTNCIFLCFSIVLFLFTVLWGANYGSNISIAQRIGIFEKKYSMNELYDTAFLLVQKANACSSEIYENSEGLTNNFEAVTNKIPGVFEKLGQTYEPLRSQYYAKPKKVYSYTLLSYLGISGIYTPFTAEANININIPTVSMPFTMCHEVAHRLCAMHEDDANLVAFLAGICSDEISYQYSSYFIAYIYVLEELYENNAVLASQIRTNENIYLTNDIVNYCNSAKKYETAIMEIGQALNHMYIKAMGDSDGVSSYNRIVGLLCSFYSEQSDYFYI